ncbi:hypothetical protein TH61_05095 [Rufibacter sp. DG15C]|uniref:tetratricopeptide repeat protein n=1 Tax=Rufibacter sp. DG15C TaxID=1379909 RepID=UPI00078B7916|nr:hypothetical protein [Rufibacter sp. DG15C]AMM50677.1 hypothetical protein TH61_05095 [Rufibacter sp. DG15C]
MKKLLWLLLFIVSITQMQAQSKRWAEWQKRGEKQINLLPMYGGQPKSKNLLALDKKFLASVDKKGGTRAENSKYFSDRGWQHFQQGDFETAMFRFNQAWLLDSTNAKPYWGFGIICGMLENYDDAFTYLHKAYALDSSDVQLLCDIVFTNFCKYQETNQALYIENALVASQKALRQSPDHAFALYSHALVQYMKNDYASTWEYLYKAKEKGEVGLDQDFIKALHAQLPDPKKEFVKD